MQGKTPIAVLASGTGSNFRALMLAVRDGRLSADIRALICDKPKAPVLDLAESFDVPAILVDATGLKRPEHEEKLLNALAPLKVEWLVLAGYMRILSEEFLKKYRAVNIHPSLLPAFPGKNAYEQAFKSGCKQTGVTVHLVSPVVDGGPILAQTTLDVLPGDTLESLTARGLKMEHELYAKTLESLFQRERKKS